MKIHIFIIIFVVTFTHSANLRKRRNVDDGFILTGPGGSIENKPSEDDDDDFILVGNYNGEDKPNGEDDNDFILTEEAPGNPGEEDLPLNTGSFWHLTDLHWDPYYNLNAENANEICPSSNGAAATDPGPYGDYRY